MADLVDGPLLRIPQRSIWKERILLEEETNLIAGGHEVIISKPVLFARRKDRHDLLWIKLLDQLLGPRAQSITLVFVRKPLEHEKPLVHVLLELLFGDH